METKNALVRSITGVAKRFAKSRMGIAGIIILLSFIAMALSAPYLTPYDPQFTMQLASFRAKPSWLDPSLSPNLHLISDSGFSSPDTLTELIPSLSALTISWSDTEGYPGIPLVKEGSGPGSMLVALTALGTDSITLEKAFNYQYTPPRRFTVNLAYKVAIEGIAVWSLQVWVKQPSGSSLLLWDSQPQSASVGWTLPKPAIDTNDISIRFRLFNDILGDATRVFPDQGAYSLILKISTSVHTENGAVRLYFDDLDPRIWGEAFGLLGTDNYGRDIFTQLVHGSRISILIGMFSAFIAVLLGLLVGLTAGYVGGWIDELLMRTNDILLTLPALPLMIVLTAVIGPSIWSVIILIGLLGWMGIARLIRSQVLSLKTKAFIEASRASGGGTGHIIRKHLLPNVMTMAYTQLALTVPGAIVTEAALSFIGLGDPFLQTWGKMLHDVQYYGAIREWWWALPPGLCISLLSMAFVFIGYALDDILNPKLRRR
jgi:peptide/nickel transport system permease protein